MTAPDVTSAAVMDPEVVEGLRHELSTAAGLAEPVRREPVRVWRLSGVERLHLPGGRTVVFKYATAPFTDEDRALRCAADHGVPVPALHAAAVRRGLLGMVMEDLGAHVRVAADTDAVLAAARLHRTGPVPDLATFGQRVLETLPATALAYLDQLRADDRFTDPAIGASLHTLDRAARERAAGADLPPFGLCHGELHPTSLHIGAAGWRLLDLAKAFNGPGLLDLATWQGTRNPPDPIRLQRMIRGYVAAGGHRAACAERGGLPAELWALGWHRVSAATWYLQQAARNIHDEATDHSIAAVVRRQLAAAAILLR